MAIVVDIDTPRPPVDIDVDCRQITSAVSAVSAVSTFYSFGNFLFQDSDDRIIELCSIKKRQLPTKSPKNRQEILTD